MFIENLVEMHCHILPGIDDGSPDIETSLRMIARLQQQGCNTIVLTPHYYSDEISLTDFLRRRERSYSALINALPPGSPRLIPAAEVYISQYLFTNDDLSELKIGNSDYALIEHPFSSSFSQGSYDRLSNLRCDYGIKPILAHIERYGALMDDTYRLEQFIEMGCLAQVNISSFADSPRQIRKKLIKLMNTGHIHLVGSDCHNLESRPPEYIAGMRAIYDKCGQDAIETLIHNANQLTK